MHALEAMLRPVVGILNKNIHESTPARKLCATLSGSVVAVRVRDTALAVQFEVDDETLILGAATDTEPDVIISGSLLTLAKMSAASGEAAIRDGSLDMSGDAEVAQQFQELLSYAKPDIEEELSGIIGDVAAHRIGEMARGLRQWGQSSRQTMGDDIREYLQEESRDAPSRYEFDRFSGNVNKLRDDVDRIEARIKQIVANT